MGIWREPEKPHATGQAVYAATASAEARWVGGSLIGAPESAGIQFIGEDRAFRGSWAEAFATDSGGAGGQIPFIYPGDAPARWNHRFFGQRRLAAD